MKNLWKKMSLGLLFTFILTIFSPYSALADELTPSLNKDVNGNYTITSVADLNMFRSDIDKGIDYSGKNVVLTQDIDISKSEVSLNSFTTNKGFNGTFDGKFHTISSYTDTSSGLFGVVSKDGAVQDVKIDANVDIVDRNVIISSDSTTYYYGLIANEASGTIDRCFTTGKIESTVKRSNIKGPFIGAITGSNKITDSSCIPYKTIEGVIDNCSSNIIFNNNSQSSTVSPNFAGITYDEGISIKNCIFYGEFQGNDQLKQPILGDSSTNGSSIKETCVYDSEKLGVSNDKNYSANGNPAGYTTKEMKNVDNYKKLGFDFDKTWKIDPSVNDGYPYLNSENVNKVVTTIPVDVQITAEDKTYDTNLSVADNLKATVKGVKVVAESSENQALISKYNVVATYDGDISFWAPTIGEVPLRFDLSKVKLTYDKNDDYKFILSKALPSTAKLKDNGASGPTKEQQKEQIENAKKAQNILYKKLEIGQGSIPEFTWDGGKSPAKGEEGSIEFIRTDPWGIFSAARSGYKGIREGYYDEWFKNVQDGLKKMKAAGITMEDVKKTEWEKLVLAITAIGYDPRDIEAYDLIDIISNNDYKSHQFFAMQYANFALNSYNYAIPKDGNRIDLEAGIHDWAKDALGTTAADGSTVAINTVPDMAVMQNQPIAAYYNSNAKEGDKYYDVKVAMEHVLDNFSNAQTYRGSFYGGYGDQYNNAWTNAQVYITLGMAHVDIFDKKYIKNGKSILDGALEFYDVEKGTTIFEKNNYEPPQMGRGLESLIRAYEGRNNIFDCTDVKDSTVPVNNAIKALSENITSDNKAEVAAARALYDGLSEAKKTSMKDTTKAKLMAAEAKVNESSEPALMQITNLTSDSTVKLGNDAKVSVKAVNNSSKVEDAVLIVALYDGSGKSIRYTCGKNAIKAGDSSVLTAKISLPSEGKYTLKAFVCDSLENMKPISNIIDITIK